MSAVTVRVLDEHLADVQTAGRRYGAGPVQLGPMLAYADAISKAPRLVLVGHLARLTARALVGPLLTARHPNTSEEIP